LTVTVGFAYGLDKPLYPSGVYPTGHTHAFDIYTHPYSASQSDNLNIALTESAEFYKETDFGGTVLMVGLVCIGIAFAVTERFVDLKSWYARPRSTQKGIDLVLPGWVLGLITVSSLVVASIGGAYIYYPPSAQLLPDLFAIHTECVIAAKTKKWNAVEKWVPMCDELSRRLEVGVFLREGSVSEYRSAIAANYREKLATLRDAIEVKNYHEIDALAQEVANAYLQLSAAYKSHEKTR
ncbi:MAG: hypothetical protein VX438_18515, partial [Planctomycetota bacterium]|nr:hypothetical protein [Planctomycetota bacterium]